MFKCAHNRGKLKLMYIEVFYFNFHLPTLGWDVGAVVAFCVTVPRSGMKYLPGQTQDDLRRVCAPERERKCVTARWMPLWTRSFGCLKDTRALPVYFRSIRWRISGEKPTESHRKQALICRRKRPNMGTPGARVAPPNASSKQKQRVVRRQNSTRQSSKDASYHINDCYDEDGKHHLTSVQTLPDIEVKQPGSLPTSVRENQK